MTTALDRTRRTLDQPPVDLIPGQLDLPPAEPEHDEQRPAHHQPTLWSL